MYFHSFQKQFGKIMNIFSRIRSFFTLAALKKILIGGAIACLAIGSILVVRSCSSQKELHKTLYFIGRDNSWYPLQLLGRERNLVAFSNDLMSLIAKEIDLRFQWVETSPNALFEGLDNGSYDAVLTSIRPNILNQQRYVFSELVFEIGPVLVVRQDDTAASLSAMKGKTIGVLAGSSTAFNAVREEGINVYDFFLVTYSNTNRAMEQLINNQIDGIIMEALPAYTLSQGFYAGKAKVVTAPLTDEGLRVVVLKNGAHVPLIDKIDEAIDKLKENGSYDALIAKWHLVNAEKEFWHPPAKDASP
jgi:polar amino acid transport system substrate-binding protein